MHSTKKINNNEVSLLLEQNKELISLQLKIKLMQQLTTASGFFSFYFKKLHSFLTSQECFNYVNDLYFKLFGYHRFSSYSNFKSWEHGNA
jgi:hypothetical protein